jgi:hypothetical protein
VNDLGVGGRGTLDGSEQGHSGTLGGVRSKSADGVITSPLGKERPPFSSAEKLEAIEQLMRIHYNVFMANPRFWYDKELQAADMLICVVASDLRRSLR